MTNGAAADGSKTALTILVLAVATDHQLCAIFDPQS